MRHTCFPWTRHPHSLCVQVDGNELQIFLAFAAAGLEQRAWERSPKAKRLYIICFSPRSRTKQTHKQTEECKQSAGALPSASIELQPHANTPLFCYSDSYVLVAMHYSGVFECIQVQSQDLIKRIPCRSD